ncbi:hemolymph lipopolysaccharide-binding protein [Anabrus simplex]|uniref:hemolymph lipopolysaccharide-binding protein n=1 Tax=Anabrus simplex TaxID=316456 RepID=UPI0034DD773F
MLWRAAVVLLVVPILRVHMSVREGYELYAGLGYYKFFPDWGNIKGLSWSEAHDVCHNDGGHLPIINSQAEFDLLYSIFKEEVAIPAFSPLGFHDFFLDGHFVTIYGQSLSETGYMVWGPPCDDPHKCGNDTSKAHCGVMSRFSPGLYVHRCDQLFGFFCEKELW